MRVRRRISVCTILLFAAGCEDCPLGSSPEEDVTPAIAGSWILMETLVNRSGITCVVNTRMAIEQSSGTYSGVLQTSTGTCAAGDGIPGPLVVQGGAVLNVGLEGSQTIFDLRSARWHHIGVISSDNQSVEGDARKTDREFAGDTLYTGRFKMTRIGLP